MSTILHNNWRFNLKRGLKINDPSIEREAGGVGGEIVDMMVRAVEVGLGVGGVSRTVIRFYLILGG